MKLQINLPATYDTETDTLHVVINQEEKPVKVMPITGTAMIELDIFGDIVGLEILKFDGTKK